MVALAVLDEMISHTLYGPQAGHSPSLKEGCGCDVDGDWLVSSLSGNLAFLFTVSDIVLVSSSTVKLARVSGTGSLSHLSISEAMLPGR